MACGFKSDFDNCLGACLVDTFEREFDGSAHAYDGEEKARDRDGAA